MIECNIYEYKGLHGCASRCGLKIEVHTDGRVEVTLTERADNTGTSITNFYEHLATKIYHEFLEGVRVDNITWIEHYPDTRHEETFDEVTMNWDGRRFHSPTWKPYKKED